MQLLSLSRATLLTQTTNCTRFCRLRTSWIATPVAAAVRTECHAMIQRHAAIKDKALTLPKALGLWHDFQVFQNSAFQMINFWEALGEHVG